MAKLADLWSTGTTELPAALRKRLRTSNVLWMPSAVIANTRLTWGAKILYSVLLNQSWTAPVVAASHGELARAIGASVRATRNYVDELRQARLIALQTRPGKPSLYSVARQ
jgi:hypothetical protein